jgi:predicted nucleic acid-binding protein
MVLGMVVSGLLDACVLYPVGLRDTLLNVAEAGFYRVLWTEEILTETRRNIVEDTSGLTPEHLDRTFEAMRRAFPEAMVRDYEHLVESMTNHPKDRHVLAAAVAAEADVVVTREPSPFPVGGVRSSRYSGPISSPVPRRFRRTRASTYGPSPLRSGCA